MNGCDEACALDLVDGTKRERKAKEVAGRRLLPRPAASKMVKKMSASLEGAC